MNRHSAVLFIVALTVASICAGTEQYFHVAAHNPGVNDTMWLTDAQVFNPDAVDTIEVRLAFLARGQANTDPDEVAVSIEPRQAVLLSDLVSSVLGRAQSGSIRMSSDHPFYAASRTYNIGDGESGTFGQYVAAASTEDALEQGLLQLASNNPSQDGFRTNVGFVNPNAESASVDVAVYDADSGVLLGTSSLDLEPFGFFQINNVFEDVGHASSLQPNAVVEFLATEAVLAYGSIVDNTSGDAIFVTPSGDSGTPPPGNNPPVATIDQPSADAAIGPGETVFFSGSASDPDGDDVTVLWDFGDGMTSTELEPGDHTFGDAGQYTVTLTATDDQGLADPTPATRTITVEAPNSPPDATIDQPSGNVTITEGASVFFSGSISDPDGDTVTVLWDFGDAISSANLNPGNHTYSSQGTYTVTLTATDSQGLADPTPATRTITVNAAPSATLTRIQNEIFSPSCTSCHGGGSPTADLDLDPGQAHGSLVNVPATTESGTRVIPSNPNNSVLVTFLEDGHRSRPQSEIDLIRDWITSGAPNN